MSKTFIISSALFAAALAAPAQAAPDCDAPAGFVEVKACNAAKQGIDVLRRFVWRTRMHRG